MQPRGHPICNPNIQTTSRGEQVFSLITRNVSVNAVQSDYNNLNYVVSNFDMLCLSHFCSGSVVYHFL